MKPKITVQTAWDDEAHVWVAVAVGHIGLVAEAKTIEALAKKLPGVALDLLEDEISEEPEIELIKLEYLDQLFAG